MGLFGLGKKGRVLDLTKNYERQKEKAEEKRSSEQSSELPSQSAFNFLGNLASSSSDSSSSSSREFSGYVDVSSDAGDKKRKLARRLIDMTEKLEELSNQIYHLQQRVELLEKKNDVGRF
ncbi:MAG: hypothetical protein ABIA78_04215 [archaeon]